MKTSAEISDAGFSSQAALERFLEVRVCDPAAGSGHFLSRPSSTSLSSSPPIHPTASEEGPSLSSSPRFGGSWPSAHLRRRHQPHGDGAGPSLPLARDCRSRAASDLPREPTGRQLDSRHQRAKTSLPAAIGLQLGPCQRCRGAVQERAPRSSRGQAPPRRGCGRRSRSPRRLSNFGNPSRSSPTKRSA